MKIPERLKSRKLWMTLAGLVAQLLLAYSGEIESETALKTVMATVMAYLVSQGYVDAK